MLSGLANWLYQSAIIMKENEQVQKNQKKQFYYLSLLNNNSKWHIHGLWPQYNDNTYPEFCNKNKQFDYDSIKSLVNELDDIWYSDKETNEDFWKHEWLKHGTCMYNKCSELDYFKTAIYLMRDSESKNIIEKCRIKGTNKSMIPYDLNFNYISKFNN